ncbi:MAG: TolC family protein [Flavipsychrobacter sp.]|nr:TolC family protein [Flavipsychrobacter sp.]
MQDSIISLPELIKYALASNQTARKARLDIENTTYRINEVRSAALPQISGSAGLNYNPLLQQSALPGDFFGQPGTTILVALGQKWNSNAGVSFSQALFNQGVLTGLKAATTTREFYRINAQLTEEGIIEQVATGYYGLILQQQQLIALDSTIENTRELLNILQSQLKNGLVKKIDVDRVSVSATNLEARRQQIVNGISISENQLKFLAGIPINQPITFENVDVHSIKPSVMDHNPDDYLSRTEFRLLQSQKRLLELQRESYKAEYYPTLSLSGNYSYQGLGNEFPFKAEKRNFNWFDVATFGLNLRVPLFNGMATRSRIHQADIALAKLGEDISQTQQAMNLDYENAVLQINNNLALLKTQQQNVKLAEDVYQNTIANYNYGLATLADLLSAENGLTDAQTNYLTTLLNYRLAEIKLLKSKGALRSILQ